MTDAKHKQIHFFSLALKELGKDISILKSIRWPLGTEEKVLQDKFKVMPSIAYAPLDFDVAAKLLALGDLKRFINASSLEDHYKNILMTRAESIESIIFMLDNRAKKEFGHHSKELYGSSLDYKKDNITDILFILKSNYLRFNRHDPKLSIKNINAEDAVKLLASKIKKSFPGEGVSIKLSNKITSEASTGKNYIKINKKYLYSENDINIFDVHEAHVHLATNLNACKQTNAPWLGIHTPRATRTQEGLALFMEFMTQVMTLDRLDNIANRSKACELAESGANFLEVCEYFRVVGLSERDCFKAAQRVFRGTDLKGGSAFTKDLSYVLGFLEVYRFIEDALASSEGEVIELLFTGKTTLDEIELLKNMKKTNDIKAPQYIPELIEYSSILEMKMLFMNLLAGVELHSLNTISEEKVA